MIKKAEGRTYDMLRKDKRVEEIRVLNDQAMIFLAPPYYVPSVTNDEDRRVFDNWCDARNWVRKAVDQKELAL